MDAFYREDGRLELEKVLQDDDGFPLQEGVRVDVLDPEGIALVAGRSAELVDPGTGRWRLVLDARAVDGPGIHVTVWRAGGRTERALLRVR